MNRTPKLLREAEIERQFAAIANQHAAEVRWQAEVMAKMAPALDYTQAEFAAWERRKLILAQWNRGY